MLYFKFTSLIPWVAPSHTKSKCLVSPWITTPIATTPSLPLPFLSIASQKNFIGFYHMGIYAKPDLLDWFVQAYPKHCKRKLDMGKSCIRLKKMDDIPYQLIEELVKKVSVQDWIDVYEKNVMNHRKKK